MRATRWFIDHRWHDDFYCGQLYFNSRDSYEWMNKHFQKLCNIKCPSEATGKSKLVQSRLTDTRKINVVKLKSEGHFGKLVDAMTDFELETGAAGYQFENLAFNDVIGESMKIGAKMAAGKKIITIDFSDEVSIFSRL